MTRVRNREATHLHKKGDNKEKSMDELLAATMAVLAVTVATAVASLVFLPWFPDVAQHLDGPWKSKVKCQAIPMA